MGYNTIETSTGVSGSHIETELPIDLKGRHVNLVDLLHRLTIPDSVPVSEVLDESTLRAYAFSPKTKGKEGELPKPDEIHALIIYDDNTLRSGHIQPKKRISAQERFSIDPDKLRKEKGISIKLEDSPIHFDSFEKMDERLTELFTLRGADDPSQHVLSSPFKKFRSFRIFESNRGHGLELAGDTIIFQQNSLMLPGKDIRIVRQRIEPELLSPEIPTADSINYLIKAKESISRQLSEQDISVARKTVTNSRTARSIVINELQRNLGSQESVINGKLIIFQAPFFRNAA